MLSDAGWVRWWAAWVAGRPEQGGSQEQGGSLGSRQPQWRVSCRSVIILQQKLATTAYKIKMLYLMIIFRRVSSWLSRCRPVTPTWWSSSEDRCRAEAGHSPLQREETRHSNKRWEGVIEKFYRLASVVILLILWNVIPNKENSRCGISFGSSWRIKEWTDTRIATWKGYAERFTNRKISDSPINLLYVKGTSVKTVLGPSLA